MLLDSLSAGFIWCLVTAISILCYYRYWVILAQDIHPSSESLTILQYRSAFQSFNLIA